MDPFSNWAIDPGGSNVQVGQAVRVLEGAGCLVKGREVRGWCVHQSLNSLSDKFHAVFGNSRCVGQIIQVDRFHGCIHVVQVEFAFLELLSNVILLAGTKSL